MFQIGVHIEWYLITDYIIDRILYHVINHEILASMHFHGFHRFHTLVKKMNSVILNAGHAQFLNEIHHDIMSQGI